MTSKLRVGVLFGGKSGEHEVSLASARSVMAAMDPAKYEVVPIGIDKAGRWLLKGDPMLELTAGQYRSFDLLPSSSETRHETTELDSRDSKPETGLLPTAAESLNSRLGLSLDVIFPVLHGPNGEDGTVQGLLDLLEIPYVGCGVLASAVGMDKVVMKEIFTACDLPILPYQVVKRHTWQKQPELALDNLEAKLTYPMFVKPANMGSSVGISKAHNRVELAQGLNLAARYDRKLVVEQGIEAREIEVSVLGNDEPTVSVPGEVVPSNEWYDYAAKYVDNKSELRIPASLDRAQTQLVQSLALQAFAAIDGSGLSRVDFLVDQITGTVYLNEVNTLPGFTPISMYAKLMEASGIPYSELIDRLVDLALTQAQEKRANHE